MSLVDLPINEELKTFGFPWHGLFVAPVDGPPYVRLASGRQIFSPSFMTTTNSSTYLFEPGLPEPELQPDDPEAQLWNRCIATGTGGEAFFSFWGGIPGDSRRRYVQLPHGWSPIAVDITHIGTAVRVRADLTGPDGFLQRIEASVPLAQVQDLPSRYSMMRLLDVSPDGRKWLLGLEYQMSLPTYPYAIRVDRAADEGVGAILEMVCNEDFTACTASVLAGYDDCIAGNLTAHDGGPLEQQMLWLVSPVGGPWTEWGPDEPPTPPYKNNGEPGGPWKFGIAYGSGSATAQAVRETPVSAWYNSAGGAELVWLRISTSLTLSAGQPTVRNDIQQWWSPYTRVYDYSVEVRLGGGAWQPFFTAGWLEDQSPNSTTYTLRFSGHEEVVTEENAPVIGADTIRGEIITGTVGPRHDFAPRAARAAAGQRPTSMRLEWYAAFPSSNKVHSAICRRREGSGDAELFEYICGAAITPDGVVTGDVATGNLVPGHDRSAGNFDQALWDYHRTFARGAYNPVTREVERQRLGGAEFTWV